MILSISSMGSIPVDFKALDIDPLTTTGGIGICGDSESGTTGRYLSKETSLGVGSWNLVNSETGCKNSMLPLVVCKENLVLWSDWFPNLSHWIPKYLAYHSRYYWIG